MSGVSVILDLARRGRITPVQGATLLELRRELAWRRQPLWYRALVALFRALC
jgi:hypothetical protein